MYTIILLAACSPSSVDVYETAKPEKKIKTAEQIITTEQDSKNKLIRLTQKDLAEELDIEAEKIGEPIIAPETWSDTSLGCPQPDMMYAQVLTEGYKLIYEVKGQVYEYHTDTDSNFVLCVGNDNNKSSEKSSPTASSEQTVIETQNPKQKLIQMTQQDLAEELDIEAEKIGEPIITPETWSDTSLGCPQPGMMYAQVMTEGYKLVYKVKDQVYEYHTDMNSNFVLCNVD